MTAAGFRTIGRVIACRREDHQPGPGSAPDQRGRNGMSRTTRGSSAAVWTLAALVGATRSEAQDLSLSSAFEAAGDEVYVVFVQPSVAFGPEVGWRPDLRLGAYHVWTSGDDGWGITP